MNNKEMKEVRELMEQTRRKIVKPDAAPTGNCNATETKEKVGNQLKFWPDGVGAMPTELTRTSLFGLPSDRKGARKILDAVRIDSRSDVEILYTGKQLSAKDETLWLACLRIGRGVPMGQRIYINKIDLLRELGLTNNGQNWKAVAGRLNRLSVAHFNINFKRNNKTYSVTTGMLKWGIENETGNMYIRLDPDGAKLFENLAYQPWQVRLSLTSDLSAILLSYISGHQQGMMHSQNLENLKAWCGYGGETRKFRAGLLSAMAELEQKGVLITGSSKIAKGGRGEVVSWIRSKIAEHHENKGEIGK